jgi:ABC-type glycerol-3-phosphate transport system substrate-binding protein
MRPAFLILALLAVVLAAGCGGGSGNSTEEFQSSVVETRNTVDDALAHITDNPSGKEELLQRMEQAATKIDAAAESLSRKEAPEEMADEQQKLVTSLQQLAVDLSQTADQIRQPDFGGVLQNAGGLSFESWEHANAVLAQLKKQGIEVEPLGRH